MNPHGGAPYASIISIAVVALVVALRMRRLTRERLLKPQWMWAPPALLLALTGAVMAPSPPSGPDWLWLAVILVLGGVLGWRRGKMMRITVDPQSHALSVRASPAALVFIVVLVVVRYGLRGVAAEGIRAWRLNATLVADGFLVFALGLYAVQQFEMWLRARRRLAQARAAMAA